MVFWRGYVLVLLVRCPYGFPNFAAMYTEMKKKGHHRLLSGLRVGSVPDLGVSA